MVIKLLRNKYVSLYKSKFRYLFSNISHADIFLSTIQSIGIHLFLLQHVFNRAIGLLGVAGLFLTIPSNMNRLFLLNDTLN